MIATLQESFSAVLAVSWRWTPVFLAAWLVARALPASGDRRKLWALALLALPALPLLGLLAPTWTLPSWTAAPGMAWEESTAAAETVAGPQATLVPAPGRATIGAGTWLAGLWLLGVVAMLSREFLSRLATLVLGRFSGRAPERVRLEAVNAARSLGLERPDVRLSDVKVPLLCGIVRPRVVLPAAAASWPADRLRASLLHEMAHQRHGDPWLDFAARLLGAVFFFHPGIWVARRALAHEMEQAADVAAVDAGRVVGLDEASYGRILLETARQASGGFAPGLAMARRSGLEGRLRALLRGPTSTPRWRVIVCAAVLVVMAFSAAGLSAVVDRWFTGDGGSWQLDCGGDAECAAIQTRAEELLKATERDGVILVQKVKTGELVAYASQGPAPVPLVSPASVAKLAVATLWWDAGYGDKKVPCPELWSTADGVEVRSVRDRGELMAPHEMLIHSCSTAAGAMVAEMVEKVGAGSLESSLAHFGFSPGEKARWLPPFLPGPKLESTVEWEIRNPALAASLGRVSTTPFHVASFVQAIGHGGVRLTMRRPGEGSLRGERLMTAETAERLRRSMAAAVSEGTGRRGAEALRGEPWQLLGKTGTRARDDGEYDGWFAGLAVDKERHPRFVVVAFLDASGLGGGASTLLAAEMTRSLGSL